MSDRKPKLHIIDINKLKSNKFLKNYDIIIDINEEDSEYRNQGKYIYHNGKTHKLSSYPDDYGTLPQWTELRKEDLGYSYFEDGIIDYNSYVPINSKDWKIGETRFKSDYIKPLGKFSHTAYTLTDFFREKDGAHFTLEVPVVFSNTKRGGPNQHYTISSTSEHCYGGSITYQYACGEKHTCKYNFDCGNPISNLKLTQENEKNAFYMIQKGIKNEFEKNPITYFSMCGPCKMYIEELPIRYGKEWKYMNMVVCID